jgi:multidrug efflux pump subunit AcrB
VHFLLKGEAEAHAKGHDAKKLSILGHLFAGFERGFDRLRGAYGRLLALALAHRAAFAGGFLLFVAGSVAGLLPLVGRDFFPTVDAGLIKLHVRAQPGLRIEESEHLFAEVEKTVRTVIPDHEIDTMLDNIGTPYSGINLSLSEGTSISPADGDILISLKHEHAPTATYVRELRRVLREKHPQETFFFLAPDISTQVLNFGMAAPIDVQVVGAVGNEAQTYEVTKELAARIAKVPGAVDVHLAQVENVPTLDVAVDRTMAQAQGVSERDVASDLLISLSSSSQVTPSYWLDQKRGVQYLVAVQTPQYALGSIDDLATTPISTGDAAAPQLLSNLAQIHRVEGPANVTHYNALRSFDIQANVDGADLGAVAKGVDQVIAEMKPNLPRGTTIKMKGQVESMESSFRGLGYGLVFAVILVYLLMVVNFQSWLDPFVILTALPGAIAGIAWMLFVSKTTLSVPALMGSIMCVGVATANSILVVTFANDQRAGGRDARDAALAAGMTRLRPVMMTALAMIIGMLPMSLGLGEGGEQNAPLGRAVIGGLLLATLTTLFFVPVMYSVLRNTPPKAPDPELEAA